MYKPNTYIFAYTIVHAATVGSPHLDRSAVPLRCLQMLYPDTTDYHSVFYCSVVVFLLLLQIGQWRSNQANTQLQFWADYVVVVVVFHKRWTVGCKRLFIKDSDAKNKQTNKLDFRQRLIKRGRPGWRRSSAFVGQTDELESATGVVRIFQAAACRQSNRSLASVVRNCSDECELALCSSHRLVTQQHALFQTNPVASDLGVESSNNVWVDLQQECV